MQENLQREKVVATCGSGVESSFYKRNQLIKEKIGLVRLTQ
jgi:galactitol-specific phosphotransferase system IIB component